MQMVVVKQKLQREDICVVLQGGSGGAKQQKLLCILNTIVRKAHLL